MSQHGPGIPRISRLAFSVLLAIPLALLALASVSGRASAHPAAPTAPHIGKSSGPAMDITLHFHSFVNASLAQPYRMATDPQGDLYVSDISVGRVFMFGPNDVFMHYFGSGTVGTGGGNFGIPQGIAVSGNTVFVADSSNSLIQTFNKTTGAWISDFGTGHLTSPLGMALGTNGQLYVVDSSPAARIVRFNTAGTFLGSFGAPGTGNGQFNAPAGIAASPLGFLYVTDSGNHRVEQFNLNGTYLNQWGSLGFSVPDGIAVDRAGMVYVVDRGVTMIYKFDSGGSFIGSYAAPAPTPVVAGTFSQPGDIAVRSLPNTPIAVFVSDYISGFVQRFDQVINPQYHTYQAKWGSAGTGNGQFDTPWGAVVDPAGKVYVTDENNDRVEKFDQFGTFQFAFGGAGNGNGQLNHPTGITINPNGTTIYVADFGNNRIEEFNTSGVYAGQFGSFGPGNGQFNGPEAIASDGFYLYVADTSNNRIEVFAPDGSYAWQFGSVGIATGQFEGPAGIAVDINRNELYVADYGNSRIQVFTLAGIFLTAITSTGTGTFNGPVGVFTDQRGDVYVADSGNNQIYQMDVNATRATTFGVMGSGDGQFNGPWGGAVSPTNGQIYVVDSGNSRIQRFGSPWGHFDTVGIYRPSTKTFYLRNENTTGPADIVVPMSYAQTGDLPVVGDWEGTGVDTVGLYRPSTGVFMLQDANVAETGPDYTFVLGVPGDTPIAGDWNGDGSDGAGIFRPSNGILYLKNSLSTGFADYNLVLGVPGDKGIAGDWNGDGQDSPGVYRPSNQTFYVTNKVTNGVVFSDATATLGISGDAPFTGDWVLQGSSGIGVFRPSNGVTYLKDQVSTGFADFNFIYGSAGDIPVAGEWISPQIPFSAPPPHTSLGTHTSSAPHPASGKPGPAGPGSAPTHSPAAATPNVGESTRRTTVR